MPWQRQWNKAGKQTQPWPRFLSDTVFTKLLHFDSDPIVISKRKIVAKMQLSWIFVKTIKVTSLTESLISFATSGSICFNGTFFTLNNNIGFSDVSLDDNECFVSKYLLYFPFSAGRVKFCMAHSHCGPVRTSWNRKYSPFLGNMWRPSQHKNPPNNIHKKWPSN